MWQTTGAALSPARGQRRKSTNYRDLPVLNKHAKTPATFYSEETIRR
jgi:hypothetical protein